MFTLSRKQLSVTRLLVHPSERIHNLFSLLFHTLLDLRLVLFTLPVLPFEGELSSGHVGPRLVTQLCFSFNLTA
jgi:hypothetical protein